MSKRQRYVLASLLLSLGLLSTQLVPVENWYRYLAIFGLFGVSYLISAWALFDDLKGVEWLTIVPLPGFYACSVALFYFLLPDSILSRIAIYTTFGIGMYALYLTCNIYSVAAIKSIQLLRAAHAVGFLMTMLTCLFFYNTIFSFRWPFFVNAILVFLVSFPLVLNALWSITLKPYISRQVLYYSITVSYILVQLTVAISFMPMTVWIASGSLVNALYVSLGILQQHLQNRLFKDTFPEYIMISILVTGLLFLLTPWR